MYTEASAAFYLANQKGIQKHKLRGTIGSTPFNSDDILSGSFSYVARCTDASSFNIGGVYIGVIKAGFIHSLGIGPRSWRGKTITVEFGQCISENPDVYEYIPLCTGTISEATVTAGLISITAYDNMAKFDKALPEAALISGTVYNMLLSICTDCGVALGSTAGQIEAMPNGDAGTALASYYPSDCKTYRDWLYWISQAVGGFATIGRNGKLYLRSYSKAAPITPDATITENDRLQGASISDYITQYNGVAFENIADGTTQYFGGGSEPIFYAGANPFLQYGTSLIRDTQRNRVYIVAHNISYMPFTISMYSAPIYDLGDILLLTGGVVATGRDHNGIVQAITYNGSRGLTLQGFGRDPMQKNMEDKSAAGVGATAEAKTISYYKYESDQDAIIPQTQGDTWDPADADTLITIRFVAGSETAIEVLNEIDSIFDSPNETVLNPQYVAICYFIYIDGVLQSRNPRIFQDTITTHEQRQEFFQHYAYRKDAFNFYTEITTPGTHTYTVKAVCMQNGPADAVVRTPIAGIYSLLKGQGLLRVDSWDGMIILDDETTEVYLVLTVEDLTDSTPLSVICSPDDPDHLHHFIDVSQGVPAVPFSLYVANMIDRNLLFSMTAQDIMYCDDGDIAANEFIY